MSDVVDNRAETRGIGRTLTNLGAAPWVTTVFLSAGLVFLVQPMFAKMATPLLGGAPAVWNVVLVCFQAALLAGYAYAHLLARLKSVKVQVAIHAVLLLLAAVVLPLSISGVFGAPDASRPVLWLVGTFMVSIAPPFAMISATAPLIQNWYAHSGRPDADDPYHLYAASNAGSLLGLAAYPILMEPLLGLTTQSVVWSFSYAGLALLILLCGGISITAKKPALATQSTTDEQQDTKSGSLWRERGYWLLLAAVPSGLLLAVTSHISTDVASAPFLWAPPLMAYIATFVIVFSKKPIISTKTAQKYFPTFAVLAIGSVALDLSTRENTPIILTFVIQMAALFMGSLALHGTLAERRPHAGRLTEFYLIMSLGGVVGSAAIALLAPVVFNNVFEHQLLFIFSLLLLPAAMSFKKELMEKKHLVIGCLAIGAIFVTLSLLGQAPERDMVYMVITALLICAVMFRSFKSISVAALISVFLTDIFAAGMPNTISERGFFGVVKTVEKPEWGVRMMMHGTTLHGYQKIDEMESPVARSYYYVDTPIGQVFTARAPTADRIGVVGLGVGVTACYATPETDLVFYEIDPLVAEVARDPKRFTFLSNCAPDAPIVIGDARISLQHEVDNGFDLLLLDAFSSDSIPTHLMTREAMALYLSKTAEDGVIVFHISNRHMNLEPILARIAEAEGAAIQVQAYQTPDMSNSMSSHVVILAHNEEAIAEFSADDRWRDAHMTEGRVWTDNYTNLLGAMIQGHK